MAWMKSTTTNLFYLTSDFTNVGPFKQADAEYVSAALGFTASRVSSDTIKFMQSLAEINRARLIKDIADRVLAGIKAGVSVTADVDEEAIAAAVERRLADEFATVRNDVNRPRTIS